MLVNLTPDMVEVERRKTLAIEHNFKYTPQYELLAETGIYWRNFGFNFSHEEFVEKINWDYNEIFFGDDYKKYSSSYGVADSIEQIKEHFKSQIEDTTHSFVISLTPVGQKKEKKGMSSGWRWHMWGEYIGKLNPQYEYLNEEDFGEDFKYVIVFDIYLVEKE